MPAQLNILQAVVEEKPRYITVVTWVSCNLVADGLPCGYYGQQIYFKNYILLAFNESLDFRLTTR